MIVVGGSGGGKENVETLIAMNGEGVKKWLSGFTARSRGISSAQLATGKPWLAVEMRSVQVLDLASEFISAYRGTGRLRDGQVHVIDVEKGEIIASVKVRST